MLWHSNLGWHLACPRCMLLAQLPIPLPADGPWKAKEDAWFLTPPPLQGTIWSSALPALAYLNCGNNCHLGGRPADRNAPLPVSVSSLSLFFISNKCEAKNQRYAPKFMTLSVGFCFYSWFCWFHFIILCLSLASNVTSHILQSPRLSLPNVLAFLNLLYLLSTYSLHTFKCLVI